METRIIKQVVEITMSAYVREQISSVTKLVAVERYVRLCNKFTPTYVGEYFLAQRKC
jgi:hypothetical protein